MTQKEVAERIGRKQQVIGHWETGYSQPDANTLFVLCEIYDTSVDEAFGFTKEKPQISQKEIDHIAKYRSLDSYGQATVDLILDRELMRTNTIQERDIRIEKLRKAADSNLHTYPYLHKIACAGSGLLMFDDIPAETIKAPFQYGADFVIGVNGDSMEPTFYDGDLLYVRKTNELHYGDIGIFTQGNECFVKEYGENGLIAHNPEYATIPGTSDVRIWGKVIGQVPVE